MELNFKNHLFLGTEELDHFKDSLKSNGYERLFKQSIISYGVSKLPTDTNFNALKVISGTTNGQLTVKAGMAIDSNIDAIELPTDQVDVLTTAGDSVTRYVILKYNSSNTVKGTVNITATGQVTGTGTEFTKVLRGMPNFPTVVSFNASANTAEYSVASVTNDTNMQLNVVAGSLTAETNKTMSIVGTFTPSVSIPAASKYPMQRDLWTLTLETTNTANGTTSFALASVNNNGTTTVINDLRSSNIFSLGAGTVVSSALSTTNKCIGVTGVRYGGLKSPKDKNVMIVEWGWFAKNADWSFNATSNKITITGGSGGAMATTAGFTTGDFDGWYVYEHNQGNKFKVISSTAAGGNIELIIEAPQTVPDGTKAINVVPSAEHIELKVKVVGGNANQERIVSFPISDRVGHILVDASASPNYQLDWRHVKENELTAFGPMNDGSFQPEANWNTSTEALTTNAPVAYTYAAGVPVVLNTKNHHDDKASRTENNTFTGINIFNGKVELNKEIKLGSSVISTAGYVGNDNGLFLADSVHTVTITGVGDMVFTGFTGGTEGKIGVIQSSLSSTANIVLRHENTGSSAANRINLSDNVNVTLAPGDTIWLRYEGAASRWVQVAQSIAASSNAPTWQDYTTAPTYIGTNAGNMSRIGASSGRYMIKDNTLFVNIDLDNTSSAPLASLSQVSLALPTLPAGKSVSNSTFIGSVVASTTGSNTGQPNRPVLASVTAGGGISFQSVFFDSANWTPIGGGNRIDFTLSAVIPLI